MVLLPLSTPLTHAEVVDAASRIRGLAVRTPLLRSDALDAVTGGRMYLKPECLQLTGSFKFRGAMSRLSALSDTERAGGVVAYSSGNHAQGVARAAKMLSIRAAIIMPADAPALKVARTRADGAEIIFYDRLTEKREIIAADLASERGATIIPPFDDRHVAAGQGTSGLEVAEDLAALGVQADLALVCCGGGGLTSGFAVGSAIPTIAVEPQGYDDVKLSLAAGYIISVENPGPTRCDALQTLRMGELTFATLAANGVRGVTVSEADVARAVAFSFRELKLVVEPGGSVALAAALSGAVDLRGKTAVIMLSGGNVDAETFMACLSEASANEAAI